MADTAETALSAASDHITVLFYFMKTVYLVPLCKIWKNNVNIL